MMHILLAEDNRGDIFLVRHALHEHHIEHELHVVQDGKEAFDFFAGMGKPGGPPCPDVMLLDLNLPKEDGSRVLGEFRKYSCCAQVPVIVVTSSDAPEDRARMAALGIFCYFRKPKDFDAFMELGVAVRDALKA
jgi:CheY-like chemotaxis protein